MQSCSSAAFANPFSSEEADDVIDLESIVHPFGRPVNLMGLNDNQTMTVDFAAIDGIFQNSEAYERKIVVLSIIGAFRKGKSFLMDYCLRYMYSNVSKKKLPDDYFAKKTFF